MYDEFLGDLIPDKFTSSNRCDGDIKQMESIINDIDGYNNLKIPVNNHNLSRFGTEQPCDKTKTFKLVNKFKNEFTCYNIPAERYLMKKTNSDIIDKLTKDCKLCIKTNKKNPPR